MQAGENSVDHSGLGNEGDDAHLVCTAGTTYHYGAQNLTRSLLFGVGSFDPVTLGGVLILFVVVAVLASLVPAARASRVDPLGVLCYE